MSTLETQYKNYLKENPESAFTFEEWSDWKFSNMELPPPHNGLRPIDEHAEELSDWDVTLMDGLENEPPYVSDDFQIGPDGAYEHIEYSIPIYENGIKTEYTVDGIIGDEKYYQLLGSCFWSDSLKELLDEVFKNYLKDLMRDNVSKDDPNYILLVKEEFIGRVITNPDFAKQWGVTIYTVVEYGNIRIGINYNDKTI